MSITICVKTDWPEASGVLTLPADAAFSELVSQATTKLAAEHDLAAYDVVVASYGADCVRHDRAAQLAGKTLCDIGIKNHTTVVLAAPSEIKPRRKRRAAARDEESDEEEEDEEDNQKKYKGLTVKNILGKLAKAKGKEREVCLEYVEIMAKKLFVLKEWLDLPEKTVRTILARDRLNCEEPDVLTAAVTWGTAECKRQEKKTSELKDVLVDTKVYNEIRFPCMTTNDMATKVSPSGLLDSTQLLEMFTYLGQKASDPDDDPPLGDSLKMFNTKSRNPRYLLNYQFALGPGSMANNLDKGWRVMTVQDFTDAKTQKAIIEYYLRKKGKGSQQGFKLFQAFTPSNIVATQGGYIYLNNAYISFAATSSYNMPLSGEYVTFKNHSTNAVWPTDKGTLATWLQTARLASNGNYLNGNQPVLYVKKMGD